MCFLLLFHLPKSSFLFCSPISLWPPPLNSDETAFWCQTQSLDQKQSQQTNDSKTKRMEESDKMWYNLPLREVRDTGRGGSIMWEFAEEIHCLLCGCLWRDAACEAHLLLLWWGRLRCHANNNTALCYSCRLLWVCVQKVIAAHTTHNPKILDLIFCLEALCNTGLLPSPLSQTYALYSMSWHALCVTVAAWCL